MPTVTQKRSADDLNRRAFAGQPTSVDLDTGTFEIVVTTETPVTTWVPDPNGVPDAEGWVECVEADEILLAAGLDYSRVERMPLLDSHDSYSSIDKILGRVENVRVEGQSVVATARLTSTRAALLPDIAAGFYGNISAGYCVDPTDYEYIQEPGQRLKAIAKKWTLQEASLVAIGADPYASVRTANGPVRKRAVVKTKSKERSMDLEELVMAAEDAIAAVMDATDGDASEEVVARAKAIRAFGEAEADPEKKDDTNDAGGDAAQTDEEKKATEEVRSLARSYGKTKLIDDLVKLGARSTELRKALRSAIAAGAGAGAADTQAVKPVTNAATDAKRSAELATALDPATLFARRKRAFQATK